MRDVQPDLSHTEDASGGVAAPAVEQLPWDTEFFGFRLGSANMRKLDLDETIAQGRALGLECVYLTFRADDLAGIEGAIRRGARLVDFRMRLFAPWQELQSTLDERVRLADESDRPRLLAVAHRGARMSRFARDPHFDADRVLELYERQLDRCFTDGGVVLSALGGSSVFAWFTVGTTAEVVLVEVDPRERNLGLSLSLARVGVNEARRMSRPFTRAFANIGASRIAALRLSMEMGMRIRGAAVVLHLWLDELEDVASA